VTLGTVFSPSTPFLGFLQTSGALGLAFAGNAHTTNTPVWQAALAQAPSPEFAIWLRRTKGTKSAGTEGPGGVFTLGGVNASLFSGDVEYLNVTGPEDSFWQLNISGAGGACDALELSG
jgi:cathepsin D